MSTRQTSAGSGPERRIAPIKPSGGEEQAAHAVQLFDSVLWVFKGTTRSSWVATPPAAADILVVHHSEPAAVKERATRPGADPWTFVEALRTLRTVNNSTLWLMCKSAHGRSFGCRAM